MYFQQMHLYTDFRDHGHLMIQQGVIATVDIHGAMFNIRVENKGRSLRISDRRPQFQNEFYHFNLPEELIGASFQRETVEINVNGIVYRVDCFYVKRTISTKAMEQAFIGMMAAKRPLLY